MTPSHDPLQHHFWATASAMQQELAGERVSTATASEHGIRNHIQQWYRQGDIQEQDFVEFRFLTRGVKIAEVFIGSEPWVPQ